MKPKRNEYDLDERAAEATFLINHPLFKEAIAALRARYVDEIAAALTGSQDMISAHAKLKVLQEVHSHIQSIIDDKKMTIKKGVRYD